MNHVIQIPTGGKHSKANGAAPPVDHAAEIARLVALSNVEYAQQRTKAASDLGITLLTALDKDVAAARAIVEAVRKERVRAEKAAEKAAAQAAREAKAQAKAQVKAAAAAAKTAAAAQATQQQGTADAQAGQSVDQLIADLNKQYLVVNEAGSVVIYQETYDRVLQRRQYTRFSFDDFNRLYLNATITLGVDGDGKPITKRHGDLWLKHPDRRQFIGGIVFDPSSKNVPSDTLNLWRGFEVTPKPGSWNKMECHIHNIICSGNRNHSDWVLDWLARLVQFPGEQGEVAIVMKGGEGVGKGILARAICRILGQHGLAISNAKHLTGQFNAHLRDCVFLFADEAFYAGDKAHVSVLRAIITEPHITIEGKYQNAVQSPNFLHVIMASNDDWVVPAAIDSRRFFVLNVSGDKVGDRAYFADIQHGMDHGGYEAMLHDLLRRDISGFNPRSAPVTAGLIEQRKLSSDTATVWWLDVLHRGYVFSSKLGLENHFTLWHEEMTTEILFASYMAFAKDRRERHPLSRETFGRFMTTKAGAKPRRLNDAPIGEHITEVQQPDTGFGLKFVRTAALIMRDRPHGYHLGNLAAARVDFVERTKLACDWQDQDVEDEP